MHRDARDPGLHDVELAGVQTGPDLDAELMHALDDREGAADGASRPVEDGEKPVATSIDLAAAESRQLCSDQPVVIAYQSSPARIAEGDCPARRLHHVGEQHGCEDAVGLGYMARASQELADLVGHRLGITDPDQVVAPVELHEARVWDPLGEVAAAPDVDSPVACAMQDQCRRADDGQDLANVDLQCHLQHSPGCGRAGAEAQELRPPPLEAFVVDVARGPRLDVDRSAPVALHRVEAGAVLLQRGRPWVVSRSDALGVGPIENKSGDPLGIGRREEHAHRSAF